MPPPTPTLEPAPTAAPTQAPAPAALDVTGLTITPQPVRSKAEARFTLTVPARVSVQVLDDRGSVVRTLVAGRDLPSGSASVFWDRRDDSGRRVKAGTYVIRVQAIAPDAQQDQASASITAS
jgi:flagellar hook assembly protein FlgD